MHLFHQRNVQEHSGPSPDFTSPFKHFKKLQFRQQYHQVPIHSSILFNLPIVLFPPTNHLSRLQLKLFFSLQIMEGKRTQGKGYLKTKPSVSSYLVEEEIENDMDGNDELGREEEKRVRGSSGSSSRLCQVDRCTADLKEAKQYHRRHKVCEVHAKASSVFHSGLSQRFCQQCSRFHELQEFDEAKRSCRRRLAGHNERRRKSSGESFGEGSSGRRGIITGQERSRVEMTLPMPNSSSFKRPQIR